MDFGSSQRQQQWPLASPPLFSPTLTSGISLPLSLPAPRSRSPSYRLQKAAFPSSSRASQPTSQLHSYTSPVSLASPIRSSSLTADPNTSPTLKRNSGGSSSSSTNIDTTDWRSSTNVYIKGLPEKCTNQDLQLWAEQVAKPVSVKTIRDARDPGICTGLGFVRFALAAQAKLFIAVVNAVDGYEAVLAKETYVGKMEKASDPRSANLYLSHIPLHYNEQDVLALFPAPTYIVRSLRLLHEGDQPGQRAPPGTPFKGAGFIRLDTREMAERAISELNGKRLPGHGRRSGRSTLPNGELHTYYDTLQVRFADTEVQKQIKVNETEMEKRYALEAILSRRSRTIREKLEEDQVLLVWELSLLLLSTPFIPLLVLAFTHLFLQLVSAFNLRMAPPCRLVCHLAYLLRSDL
ncbi:hypothetical protein P389DRAFT_94423 [Cystobasidium minutum MCA 4210]|uniref:uncharacterized protein n=1 Tax=Cystobasidium minutum MCA 4210 TaxID=1397322 RepID=UPI0034CE7265|eukprot:jgi/Rhomi1/94423/CE94422_97